MEYVVSKLLSPRAFLHIRARQKFEVQVWPLLVLRCITSHKARVELVETDT